MSCALVVWLLLPPWAGSLAFRRGASCIRILWRKLNFKIYKEENNQPRRKIISFFCSNMYPTFGKKSENIIEIRYYFFPPLTTLYTWRYFIQYTWDGPLGISFSIIYSRCNTWRCRYRYIDIDIILRFFWCWKFFVRWRRWWSAAIWRDVVATRWRMPTTRWSASRSRRIVWFVWRTVARALPRVIMWAIRIVWFLAWRTLSGAWMMDGLYCLCHIYFDLGLSLSVRRLDVLYVLNTIAPGRQSFHPF